MSLPDAHPHPEVFHTEHDVVERYTDADPAALDRFWNEIRTRGTPLQEPDSHRVTFLWRHPSRTITPDSEPVHVHVNRVTDKSNHPAGFMAGGPGTDIWVRTLEITPTLRASYGFAVPPANRPRQGPPPHDRYPTHRDPFNRAPDLLVDDDKGRGLSLLTGALSAPQPEWDVADAPEEPRGRVITGDLALTVSEGAAPRRRCLLYLPPAPEDGPTSGDHRVPLLTLFDAETWFGRLGLPRAVERAVELGRIPPIAVLGVENLGREDRVACLGANARFLRSVATEAASWAEGEAAAHGVRLIDRGSRLIAGQSLGGLSALLAARLLPDSYGAAICQSPSLWWTPDGKSTPRDLGGRSADWITEEYAAGPSLTARLLLDVGVRETFSLERTHLLHQTLRARGWDSRITVYDGGHDFAWWRGALFDRLEEILRHP